MMINQQEVMKIRGNDIFGPSRDTRQLVELMRESRPPSSNLPNNMVT